MFHKRIKGELSLNPPLVSMRKRMRGEKKGAFVPKRDVRRQ